MDKLSEFIASCVEEAKINPVVDTPEMTSTYRIGWRHFITDKYDLPTFIKFVAQKQKSPEEISAAVIKALPEGWEQYKTAINITIDNSINIDNSIHIATETKKTLKMSLHYRLIQDDRLTFNDRILFSFLWKWFKFNRKNPHTNSFHTMRKATGWRHETVVKAFDHLCELGYIEAATQRPMVKKVPSKRDPRKYTFTCDNGSQYLAHRSLYWIDDGSMSTKDYIFRSIMATNPEGKYIGPAYLKRMCGMSKRSASRYLQTHRVGTDGVGVGTVGT